MSLKSPLGLHDSFRYQRSSSIVSSTHTDACSDGYFSEVFEGEEMDDGDSTAPLSDTLTTLINAPLANSQSPTVLDSKVYL